MSDAFRRAYLRAKVGGFLDRAFFRVARQVAELTEFCQRHLSQTDLRTDIGSGRKAEEMVGVANQFSGGSPCFPTTRTPGRCVAAPSSVSNGQRGVKLRGRTAAFVPTERQLAAMSTGDLESVVFLSVEELRRELNGHKAGPWWIWYLWLGEWGRLIGIDDTDGVCFATVVV